MNGLTEGQRPAAAADFPNVVFIAQEIPHSRAPGSILLFRLFEQWPREKIVVIGPLPPRQARILPCKYVGFVPRTARVQHSRVAWLAAPLSLLLNRPPDHVPLGERTVVVTVMQTFAYYYAAYYFARKHGLPLVIIVHDDPEEIEPQHWLTRRLFRKLCARIYRFAAHRLCISPQMNELLQVRYGAKGEVMYPIRSTNLEPRAPTERAGLSRANQLVIGYVGNVGYGYGERLDQLAPMFAKAGGTLRIYSRRPPRLKHDHLVEYAGSFEPENVWTAVKQECDVVLLPYSCHPISHQELYRTHFPSKLPEYLALGMPVIITGPEYATGVIWGLNNPTSAITICHSDEERWVTTIRQLIAASALRINLAQAAIETGNRDFDPETTRAEFLRILFESVETVGAR
jgi:glycosyltransferase involved in cell wall biosynthesis